MSLTPSTSRGLLKTALDATCLQSILIRWIRISKMLRTKVKSSIYGAYEGKTLTPISTSLLITPKTLGSNSISLQTKPKTRGETKQHTSISTRKLRKIRISCQLLERPFSICRSRLRARCTRASRTRPNPNRRKPRASCTVDTTQVLPIRGMAPSGIKMVSIRLRCWLRRPAQQTSLWTLTSHMPFTTLVQQ